MEARVCIAVSMPFPHPPKLEALEAFDTPHARTGPRTLDVNMLHSDKTSASDPQPFARKQARPLLPTAPRCYKTLDTLIKISIHVLLLFRGQKQAYLIMPGGRPPTEHFYATNAAHPFVAVTHGVIAKGKSQQPEPETLAFQKSYRSERTKFQRKHPQNCHHQDHLHHKHHPCSHQSTTTLQTGFTRQSFWNTHCGCIFSALPDEILLFNIFAFLPQKTICSLSSVCKRWRFLATDKLLWSKLDLSPYAKNIRDGDGNNLISRHGPYLQSLKLCNATNLSQNFLHSFASMTPCLEEVHLCNVPGVSDETIHTLVQNCRHMRDISLLLCPLVTDAGVAAIATAYPNLEKLSLRDCKQLTDAALANAPNSLQELSLAGCKLMTLKVLEYLGSRCPNLERLNLHGIVIDDASLWSLVQGCGSLRTVHASSSNPFGGSSKIGDEGLRALACLTHLTTLNLQGSSRITDSGVECLASGCRSIERLNLGGCYRITDHGVRTIAENMSTLTHLSLFQCFNLTDAAVESLEALSSSLRHLDLHSCVGLNRQGHVITCRFHTFF